MSNRFHLHKKTTVQGGGAPTNHITVRPFVTETKSGPAQAARRLDTSLMPQLTLQPRLEKKLQTKSLVQPLPNISHANVGLIQRGEAHVHQGIEESAVLDSGKGESSRDETMEMYAGNWMRDFSQLNLPRAHKLARQLPKNVNDPQGAKIGAAGAEDIITAVIRSLAFLHFGTKITNELVTSENIGVYTPEQHVDNPMGTTAADHLVRDSESGLLREGRQQVSSQLVSDDIDRDEQLAGKAFPGSQVENPDLYKVSDAGLGKHIYNAIEWTKEQLWQSVSAGESPTGRMRLGSALHAVEDYFAHSNFVEVALNSEIGRAVKARAGNAAFSPEFLKQAQAEKSTGNKQVDGAYVDTLYDAKTPKGRMAVTTGTAGSEDLKVSVGQILLPKLPKLVEISDRKIDEAFNLVEKNEGNSTWEEIEKQLKSQDKDTAEGAATLEIIKALDRHIQVPVHDIWLTGWSIPLTNRFIPTGYETSESSAGLISAIQHYMRLHKRIMKRIDEFETVVNILFPITLLLDLKSRIVEWFKGQISKLRDEIKRRKNEFILNLAADITGVDAKEAKKRGLDWLVHQAAHEGIEHTRGNTAIAAQLEDIKNKKDPNTLASAYGIENGEAQYAFPPSHSEISKDHPPHHEDSMFSGVMTHLKANQSEYDVGEGSLFYRLHRQLAIEADKHIISKTQEAWDEKSNANSAEALRTNPHLSTEEITKQARRNRIREEKRAKKEGRISESYGFAGQHVEDLMSLVDFFISHPDDTSWWRPILSSYVSANEPEVIKHIRQRNLTRGKRH
ncbi:HET-C-related protein [Leptothoe spongobia]|uniref:Uncharacterized protein n=1 Tax=Leptothoe spongobia TAU-MAC 1115 TaxID=1967444 RepID=A0A947DGJ4_9CYAN|nr:HET-C-related protein [Leptothoe spongobia]MBT9316652.1 hypothetical protein [Leptothoe spongobia TAU-MAC 1115]